MDFHFINEFQFCCSGADDFWLHFNPLVVDSLKSAFSLITFEQHIDQLPKFEAQIGKACLARCNVSAAGRDVWQRATVKSVFGDESTLILNDYGDEAFVKSEHLRALPADCAFPPLAYRCTLYVDELIGREIPTELLVDFFKERRPIRVFYMGTKNGRLLIRLANCDDIYLGENLE